MKSNILTKSLLNFPKIHTNEKKNNNSNIINNIKALRRSIKEKKYKLELKKYEDNINLKKEKIF